MTRRGFYRIGSVILGNIAVLSVTIPGIRFLFDPLGKKSQGGGFRPLAKLAQLTVGKPEAFAIIADRKDSWVRYEPEPIGSVWLVRQPEGSRDAVIALSAECPHLRCPVNLSPDKSSFLCPCHQASFDLNGDRLNEVSPRSMDRLEITLSDATNPEISVRFERFQPQTSIKKPLA